MTTMWDSIVDMTTSKDFKAKSEAMARKVSNLGLPVTPNVSFHETIPYAVWDSYLGTIERTAYGGFVTLESFQDDGVFHEIHRGDYSGFMDGDEYIKKGGFLQPSTFTIQNRSAFLNYVREVSDTVESVHEQVMKIPKETGFSTMVQYPVGGESVKLVSFWDNEDSKHFVGEKMTRSDRSSLEKRALCQWPVTDHYLQLTRAEINDDLVKIGSSACELLQGRLHNTLLVQIETDLASLEDSTRGMMMAVNGLYEGKYRAFKSNYDLCVK